MSMNKMAIHELYRLFDRHPTQKLKLATMQWAYEWCQNHKIDLPQQGPTIRQKSNFFVPYTNFCNQTTVTQLFTSPTPSNTLDLSTIKWPDLCIVIEKFNQRIQNFKKSSLHRRKHKNIRHTKKHKKSAHTPRQKQKFFELYTVSKSVHFASESPILIEDSQILSQQQHVTTNWKQFMTTEEKQIYFPQPRVTKRKNKHVQDHSDYTLADFLIQPKKTKPKKRQISDNTEMLPRKHSKSLNALDCKSYKQSKRLRKPK